MKAIIADDASIMRLQAVAALRRFGVEIVGEFPDGEPAIEFLKANADVDIAVLDVVMLGCTGLDVARWIKANGHKARVLLVTSMGQDGVGKHNPDVDAILIKPYHADLLISKVVEALDGQQS